MTPTAFDEEISTLRRISSFAEIENWFLRSGGPMIASFMDAINHKNRNPDGSSLIFNKFSIERPQWSTLCSNTLTAPEGKPKNLFRAANLPIGYPGWVGSLYVDISANTLLPLDILCRIGVHPGARPRPEKTDYFSNPNRYNVTLWAEEWPNLVVMERLRGSF